MKRFLAVLVLCLLVCDSAWASRKKKESVEDMAKEWNISISQRFQDGDIKGKKLSGKELERQLKSFFEGLEFLPEEFVRRTRIKRVIILDDLKIKDEKAGGAAKNETMILKKGFNKRTLYHEMFHIFDETKVKNKKWCKLNPDKFVYTGNEYYEADLSRREERMVDKESWRRKMQKHFVSEYAMSFEYEDRAETFAAMIVEGREFKKRCAKSSVMRKKRDMIIDMTSDKKLLGRKFWKKRLNGNPLE